MRAAKSTLVLVLLLTLLLAPSGTGRAEDWLPIPILLDSPMERFEHSLVEFSDGWGPLPEGEEEGTDLSTVNGALADEWQQLYPVTSPGPRFGHTMVTIENKVYLFGGANYASSGQLLDEQHPHEQLFNDVWVWDEEPRDWLEIPQNSQPPARHSHAAVELNGRMYVLFGQGGSGNFFEDLWSYDPVNNTWDEITPSGPGPVGRASHTAVVIDGAIYVLGGEDQDGNIREDLWKYDPSANTWEQKASLPAGGIREHAAAAVAGKMYIFCGEDGENPLDDLWVYVPTEDSWTQLSPSGDAPSARHGMTVDQYAEWILLIGGSSPGVDLKETREFNVSTQTWIRRTDSPLSLYKSATAAFTAGAMTSARKASGSQAQTVVLMFGGISGTTEVSPTLMYFPDTQGGLNYKIYLPLVVRGESGTGAGVSRGAAITQPGYHLRVPRAHAAQPCVEPTPTLALSTTGPCPPRRQ